MCSSSCSKPNSTAAADQAGVVHAALELDVVRAPQLALDGGVVVPEEPERVVHDLATGERPADLLRELGHVAAPVGVGHGRARSADRAGPRGVPCRR